jgi:co-chaperonin GroES (HSP10)
MQNESGISPVEYNIVVRMEPLWNETDQGDAVSEGGIILPKTKVERDKLAADEGVIVAASPLAFSYADWPDGSRIPQVGDRILMAQFDGRIWERDGVTYRLIKDKSVIAVVDQAPTLAAVA